MRDLLAPLLRRGAANLAPVIGKEAAELNSRANTWMLLAYPLGAIFVACATWAQLRPSPLSVSLAVLSTAAVACAFARHLWLSHQAALAANRYLSVQLGFPVHFRLAPPSPWRWRRRIKQEIARHERELHDPDAPSWPHFWEQ